MLTETTAKLYADDTAIVASSQSYIDLILMLRIEMSNVVEWLRLNKLTLNVSKTKLMIFGTQYKLRGVTNLDLHINNELVESVKVFKYLGVYLDQSLSFDYHIERVYKKTCSKVGLLKKVRHYIHHSTALTLYKSLVLPHIDYCDVVYMTAKQEALNKLQLVQNVACRTLLLADRYSSTKEMHIELNLHLLCERREFHFINLCHKNIFTDGERTGLVSFFKFRRHENVRTSRRVNEFDVMVPDIRSNVGRKGIGFRGPYSWNRLCNDLKMKGKFSEFVSLWKRICFSNFENHPT